MIFNRLRRGIGYHEYSANPNMRPLTDTPQVYVMWAEGGRSLKIGFSVDPAKRVAEIQTGNALQILLMDCFPASMDVEYELHGRFDQWRGIGEWFDLSHLGRDAVKTIRHEGEVLVAMMAAGGSDDEDRVPGQGLSQSAPGRAFDLEVMHYLRTNPKATQRTVATEFGLTPSQAARYLVGAGRP